MMNSAGRAIVLLPLFLFASSARAQSPIADARTLALGGLGIAESLFPGELTTEGNERTFIIPLGLLQMIGDYKALRSSSPEYDPFRALQYAANPLHFRTGGVQSRPNISLVQDLRHGALNPDLTAYRGFVPASGSAVGLIAPKFGRTIPLRSRGVFEHGVFVGGGPHLAMGSTLNVDPKLTAMFAGEATTAAPGETLKVSDRLQGQLAGAFTVGYRTAFPVGAAGYRASIAADVNYLVGAHYEDVGLHLGLQADTRGMVISRGADGESPFVVDRRSSWLGRGRALDLGVGIEMGQWEFGLRGDNLLSHITWRSPSDRIYTLNTSAASPDTMFTVGVLPPSQDIRVEGESDYRGSVGFRAPSRLYLRAEAERLAGVTYLRTGIEVRASRVQLRGALTRGRRRLQPSAGISLSAGRGRWVDLAAFTTSSSFLPERRLAVAASVRLALPTLTPQPVPVVLPPERP